MKRCQQPIRLGAFVLLATLLGFDVDAAEQVFSTDLQLDRDTVKVADPVWVSLSATAPEGWTIELPEPPDAFGELKVIDLVGPHQSANSGTVSATTRWQMESLLPGRYQIDPLEVRFRPKGADGETSEEVVQRSTEAVSVEVRSELGFFESRHLRDIHGPVRVPWTWTQWTIVAVVLVAVGAAFFFVYRGIDRWLMSRRVTQRSLLQQLDRLDEARLSRSVPNDQLIVSVADLVRQSLRLAEEPRPAYRTTEEWIDYVENRRAVGGAAAAGDAHGLAEVVTFVLRQADAVKFAGKSATVDQARRSIEAARSIVLWFLREREGVRQ